MFSNIISTIKTYFLFYQKQRSDPIPRLALCLQRRLAGGDAMLSHDVSAPLEAVAALAGCASHRMSLFCS